MGLVLQNKIQRRTKKLIFFICDCDQVIYVDLVVDFPPFYGNNFDITFKVVLFMNLNYCF